MARQAGFAHVTSTGAVAFHWERRCRVLLRDIRLLGTATFYSLLVRLFTRTDRKLSWYWDCSLHRKFAGRRAQT